MNDAIDNVFARFGATEELSPTGTPPSELYDEDAGRFVAREPRPLHNGRKALYEIKSERPEHRAIIMMAARGMGNKEIAGALGYSAQHVMYVKKQPWAVKQILEEIESAGREPVMALLHGAAEEAATRLISIAENAENDETRRKANNDILDRVFGKVTNNVSVTTKSASDLSDAELAAIACRDVKN